ncbi:MAG: glycosyltransferase family 2 protein [Zoogloeaceae bacterium]|nr:glycosyltransferase family 2 protein [Zoogloeaceae bacterium]
MTNPHVSIVVPAYNAARTIGVMIQSVLAQTFTDFELIICDDASTDDTASCVMAFDDCRIRLLRSPSNSGEGFARNAAIEAARGKWVAVLDADDAWQPSRLEVLLAAAREDIDVMVFDNILICHDTDSGLIPWRNLRKSGAFGERCGEPTEVSFSEYVQAERLLIKPLIPRDWIVRTGVKHTQRKFAADSEFFINLALEGLGFRYLPQAHYLYRISPGSATARAKGHHLMRDVLEEIASRADLSYEHREAIERKIDTLRINERLYDFAECIYGGEILAALRTLKESPMLFKVAPKRASSHLAYQLHRLRHRGSRWR